MALLYVSLMLLLLTFGSSVAHQCIVSKKMLYAIIASFDYSSLIIVNHAEMFVCTDNVRLLKVYFFSTTGITLTGIYSLAVHVIGA